jgi:hypothetical protein
MSGDQPKLIGNSRTFACDGWSAGTIMYFVRPIRTHTRCPLLSNARCRGVIASRTASRHASKYVWSEVGMSPIYASP